MGKIQQLPEDVAIKIAAGEVVERPASVVKELIENALDAGANKIEIHLKDGGKSLIAVKDNGSGMDRDDAEAAFLRHGTSKIKTIDDLYNAATLGFRGEALAAIAASSQVELVTTIPGAQEGTRVVMRHGGHESTKPHAPLVGTLITVSDLFADLPARQKFLKSDATEWKNCLDVITKQLIAHPAVGFVVKHNDRLIYDVPPHQELPSRVAEAWRLEQSKLVEVLSEMPHLQLNGVVAKPEVAHEGKARQFLSVNGHPVTDKLISKAVRDAFGTLLPPAMLPSFALNLTIHPAMADVNIHPRKDEVRFVNPQEVFRFVVMSVSRAIEQAHIAFTSLPNTAPPFAVIPNKPVEPGLDSDFSAAMPVERVASFSPPPNPHGQSASRRATMAHVPLRNLLEVQAPVDLPMPIITIGNCYLVTVHDQKLLLVDQHAAHERILYNKLWREFAEKNIVRQPLLLPAPLMLSETEQSVVNDHRQDLSDMGFGFSGEGDDLYLLEAPQLAKHVEPVAYFRSVLAGLDEDRSDLEVNDWQHKLFATMACKAAVKAGDIISEAEKRQLLDDLFATPNRFTCPHGRPSHIEISVGELEKLFKRTGF